MNRLHQTKEGVKDGEALYRRLVDMLPDAILVYCGGKCVFANAAAALLFDSTSAGKMLGLDIIDLIHPDFREFIQKRTDLVYGGEHKKFQEIKILRLDGHPVDVEIVVLAIYYQGLPALQMVLRDKTSRRLVEEVRRESKNRLRQVTARLQALESLAEGLAHDFNNVIMAILGHIEMGALAASDEKELRDRLAAAEQGCYQAQAMVQQLEIFAKGGPPQKKPQDLVKILKESARQTVTCSQACVEFSLPENLWQVEANLGQMYQAFGNLFINAAQAMPAGGVIRVQAKNLNEKEASDQSLSARKYVMVTVADQGTGIAPENLSQVFEPYFSTKPKGCGLGLATVHTIVTNHHGYIFVESKLGEGTTFRVYLPTTGQEVLPVLSEKRELLVGQG